ncbi:MAG: hypothetical protein H7328_03130 [Bdellovibrio sp.]|nr:hypothetical protein [Bdellovibrio sp.]
MLDIFKVLGEQHRDLKMMAQVFNDESCDIYTKQNFLTDFIKLYQRQFNAKKQTLYEVLKDSEESQTLIFEFMEEFAVAQILIEELQDCEYLSYWNLEISAKAKVLAKVVEDHLCEEETEFFTTAKRVLSSERRLLVGEEFKQKFEAGLKAKKEPSQITLGYL